MIMLPNTAICIPTYNQSQYLLDSVGSACQQMYLNTEVWVSDDASSDQTPEVVSELCKKYPALLTFRQPQNLGMSGNPRWILRQPKTKYIAKLDSDDLLLPNYLKVLIPLLEKFPQAGYAHAAVQQIDQNGEVTRIRRLARATGFQSADVSLRSLVSGYRVAANICLFRREALESVGFLKPDMNFCDDWDLAVRIADANWGNVYADEVLASYRVWSDAGQIRPKRKADELRGCTRVFTESLAPAFERRGWDTKVIHHQRCQMSLNHSIALDSPLFTDVEQATIVELLQELGDSPKLQRRLKLLHWGFGPYFRWQTSLKIKLKDQIKQWLTRLPN